MVLLPLAGALAGFTSRSCDPAQMPVDDSQAQRATLAACDLDPRTEGGASRSCLDRCGSARTTSRRAPLHRRLPARPQPPYRPETTVRCSRRALEHVASGTPPDVESSLPRAAWERCAAAAPPPAGQA